MSAARPGFTMGDIIRDNATRYPDVVAYKLEDHSVTHGELLRRATAIASALARIAGLQRQDRFAVLGRNSVPFGELYSMAYLSGLMMGTVNFRLSEAEFEGVLSTITPRVVFCDTEYLEAIQRIARTLPSIELVVCIDGPSADGVVGYEDLIAQGDPTTLPFVARPEDVACLIFTSGTTGASKACMLGQRELWRVAFALNTEMRTGSDDRALINMPQFHFGAIATSVGLAMRGGSIILQRQFDPAAAIAMAKPEGITLLHLAPTMVQALVDQVTDASALEGVRTIVYAAAPMNTRTLKAAMAVMPTTGFLNLYGQTEGILSGLPREFHATDSSERTLRRLTSIGFPYPGFEYRILDDNGVDLPDGQPGEIVVRSDAMFRGYWNDPVATAATLRDGWCHTGDVGLRDDEGLLYLVDRKKDVIITGGENVYSPEVEEVVLELPQVSACAIVGVPDDRWGEAVCAVVVLVEGSTLDLEQLRQHTQDRIARFKAPRYLLTLDALPVLASGKVDKKALRVTAGAATTA